MYTAARKLAAIFLSEKLVLYITAAYISHIYHIPAGTMSTHIVPALYHVCCRTLFSSGRNLAVFPKKFSAAISFYFFTSLMSCFVGKVGALSGEGKQDCLDTEAVFLLLNQPYFMRKDDFKNIKRKRYA